MPLRMDARPILYLGDTSLDTAAAYLAGIATGFGLHLDYVPSTRAADAQAVAAPRKLFILSDYPAAMMPASVQEAILQQVEAGAGLLMIGGWESYHGAGGDWHRTPLARALPVEMAQSDDRINCDQPALVEVGIDHPITAGLPWAQRPPGIGGYNRVTARPGAQVLLNVQHFTCRNEGAWHFAPTLRAPLLVADSYGQGRCVALTTDVAPHWVGGLVDWGSGRFSAQHPESIAIEVGDAYARFIAQLIRWTGQL